MVSVFSLIIPILGFMVRCDAQPAVGGSFAEVKISSGIVRGRERTGPGGITYFSFPAIPYASAPVGPFRFKAPSSVPVWNGVLDVSSKSVPVCMHMELITKQVVGVEDCLVVNVFTPANLKEKVEPELPVMVYIHGGGYVAGSSTTDLFSPGHLVSRNVIMVSLNYRLSSLGFLSTEDHSAPGNYGILDQIEALNWVQKNIHAFGGDPKQVTIFGISAGGSSVHNLILSPLAKGLFKYAISQSGTSLCDWAIADAPLANTKRLAELLDCPTDTSKKMLHCLRRAPAKELVRIVGSFHKWFLLPLAFGPVVDSNYSEDPIFPRAPVDLLATGDFNRVPWITGVTEDEGYCMSAFAFLNSTLARKLDTEWLQYCPLILDIENTVEMDKMDEVCLKIKEQYFGNATVSENLHLLTKMAGERSFKSCAKLSADLQSRFSPVYLYTFEYEGTLGWLDLVIGATKLGGNIKGLNLSKPKGKFSSLRMFIINGKFRVAHADDMFYLFDMPWFHSVPRTESDKKVLANFVDLWTNFAKFGDPTPDTDANKFPLRWPKYDPQNKNAIRCVINEELSLSDASLIDDTADQFWRSLPIRENIPKLWKREEL
ncbi:unnamed protein product [Notodromas monacha]|uniref:Carboxylic ester hydrolase n=1 Tax=Notodromas monacha TaxID=399045 RepID=A0A7R9GHB3_9CRUS|nr:unnamed protein product [Notodromas monacha]CAG0921134.1 unnamed protein product [Notodromas monacha]